MRHPGERSSTRTASSHVPPHLVRRDRLLARIDDPHARLVVVTGPAGSGKTVAVRDWVSTTPDAVAWLSLDARHTDPEHFLDALLLALEEVAPGMLEATFADDPHDVAADQAIDRAVAHLASGPRATVVIDDLHVIDRSPTAAVFARLVDVLSATQLRVVICSRSDPPLPLHRFRLAGELVELREADLRFRHDEAVEFFAHFPHVDITPDDIDRLARRTEGWAAGLQFAALSLTGRDDVAAFVDRFTGSDRHVADFLLDEVLSRQPDDVREFLLETSMLERLRADLCEHVTGRRDAAALLRRIETENLFLVPLDDEREWFRYHHLFGQLLRREARISRPQLERRGHRRAAEWFAAHGHPSRAIEHHLDARQLDEAYALITTHLQEQLGAARHETVRSWLERLPEDFVDATPEHQLLLILAFARSGALEKGEQVLRRARERADPDLDPALGIHYDVVEALIDAIVGDPVRAIELGEEAWRHRDTAGLAEATGGLAVALPELWGYLPVALARAHALLGDRDGVRRWAIVLDLEGPRLPSDVVAVLGAEAWVEAGHGRLRVGSDIAAQALALGTEVGRGARRTMIGARVAMAHIHRMRDELDSAVDVLADHLAAARREGHIAITTLGEAELALVDGSRGDLGAAISRVQRVRRDLQARATSHFLRLVLDVAECRVRLYAGDLERARDLMAEIAPGPERCLLAERAAIAAGQIDGVIERLAELREHGDRRRRFLATALSARAAAEADDVAAARTLIGEVVETAREEGAVRPFLDEGFDIDDPALGGTGTTPARPGGDSAVAARALVEPLSDRELSVLRFLPSRMSNREIGAELFVSHNTVKSHLKAIYRKLGADGRDDAVRRARQHGLI
jgi:LuxR family maltose regulon positive regulatory protein